MALKSGGGVLCIAALQILVGICLLGIYEAFKTQYLSNEVEQAERGEKGKGAPVLESNDMYRTPMDGVFYISMLSNVFSVLGLAGVLNQQKELVMAFFTYSAVQMVAVFHFFVDVCADVSVRFPGQKSLGSYEQAAAAFLFFNFALSVAATAFAIKAIDEIRTKQREEYQRLAVLSDTLQFEPDVQA